jgi:hypothetical protein
MNAMRILHLVARSQRRADTGVHSLWLGARALRRRLILEPVDVLLTHGGQRGRPLSSCGRLGFRGPVWTITHLRDPEPFAALDRRTAARELREELGTAE